MLSFIQRQAEQFIPLCNLPMEDCSVQSLSQFQNVVATMVIHLTKSCHHGSVSFCLLIHLQLLMLRLYRLNHILEGNKGDGGRGGYV